MIKGRTASPCAETELVTGRGILLVFAVRWIFCTTVGIDGSAIELPRNEFSKVVMPRVMMFFRLREV